MSSPKTQRDFDDFKRAGGQSIYTAAGDVLQVSAEDHVEENVVRLEVESTRMYLTPIEALSLARSLSAMAWEALGDGS